LSTYVLLLASARPLEELDPSKMLIRHIKHPQEKMYIEADLCKGKTAPGQGPVVEKRTSKDDIMD
jgi:hypothetical protein